MELAFYFFGVVTVIATLQVIMHTQPVYALLYFIISLISIACVFFSLGSNFAGALEIIVYAGAVIVLFVFVMMMLNFNIIYYNNKQGLCTTWIVPLLISFSLFGILARAISNTRDHFILGDLITAKMIGISLFGPYVLVVELASMLLLTGLVVSFHLGKNEEERGND